MRYRGRFAPSPTGGLHLGNLFVAFCSWARAYRAGGVCILRMEDLDGPRVVVGAAQEIIEDLNYIGLTFAEGPTEGGPFAPYVQSQRHAHYQKVADQLVATKRIFGCRCSRKELQRMASAPHVGEEGPVYPGTCREKGLNLSATEEPVSWRFQVSPGATHFTDELCGPQAEDVATHSGDFVVKRKDGLWAYHLAVVVDDWLQGITEVVRGRDLLSSTGRQLQLYRALGARPPGFAHVPLWVDDEGKRLSKRRGPGAATVGLMRAKSVEPERILGLMGEALGVCGKGALITAANLADRLDDSVLQQETIHASLDLR